MKAKLLLLLIPLVLLSGCAQQNQENVIVNNTNLAKQKCIELCESAEIDLSAGPCLSELENWNVADWVCDVAHSPREDVDNLLANQCLDYREGKAHHFVEVTLSCELIRAV